MSEYIFRFPAAMPELTFEALTSRLRALCDREQCTSCYDEIGTTVQVRWIRSKNAIMIRLYGTTIAILSDDGSVQFPADDPHLTTTEWITRIVRDNGLGNRVWRIRRHASDGPGPEVQRGHAGLLVIDGDRDKPVHGRVWARNRADI